MRPLGIVKGEVAPKTLAGFPWRAIVGQIHLLIFHTAPETLGKDVVQRSPFPIHTDLHAGVEQRLRDLRVGEVTALIGLLNLWRGDAARLGNRIKYEPEFQGLIERPTEDIATVPIEHGNQIEPAEVFRLALAQVWPWRNALDAHLAHIALDALAIDRAKLLAQYHGQLARAIIRDARYTARQCDA